MPAPTIRELNLLYVGTGNPTPVLNGPVRPGDNKWTCSILAINPDTGKLAWGFQASPHDTHDWDAAEVPVLVDGDVRRRAAQDADAGVAQRLLLRARSHDRQEPADRAVRRGELGEGDRQGRAADSRSGDRSRRETAVWSRRTRAAARTTGRRASIAKTGLFIVSAQDALRHLFLQAGARGVRLGGRRLRGRAARASSAPSTTRPARCDGSTIRSAARAAPAILTTDSGLTFTGDAANSALALRTSDGETLWHSAIGRVGNAPITYEIDGRQYVVIAGGGVLYAFALPDRPVP